MCDTYCACAHARIHVNNVIIYYRTIYFNASDLLIMLVLTSASYNQIHRNMEILSMFCSKFLVSGRTDSRMPTGMREKNNSFAFQSNYIALVFF